MSEAGIGVDIVEISRMERILSRTPSFRSRVFTPEEQAYCDASARPAAHYACRFAAREAVAKALGTGFTQGVSPHTISVTRDESGKPAVLLTGAAEELRQSLGINEIALSLSFNSDVAVANALALSDAVKPVKKTGPKDDRDRITRSFREAKSVLDDLERVQDAELAVASGDGVRHEEDES